MTSYGNDSREREARAGADRAATSPGQFNPVVELKGAAL